MAAYVHVQTQRPIIGIGSSRIWLERLSEGFWFSLCLLLFMVLGPFSAPIVLGYIFFGKLSDQVLSEPDPISK
jgi:hypothetical protein